MIEFRKTTYSYDEYDYLYDDFVKKRYIQPKT